MLGSTIRDVEVIAADDAEAAPWPRQSYVEALLAGHSARFAAELDCNLFLGFGDHDVPPVPHADVAYTGTNHANPLDNTAKSRI
jgi:hypothetical protein